MFDNFKIFLFILNLKLMTIQKILSNLPRCPQYYLIGLKSTAFDLNLQVFLFLFIFKLKLYDNK